MFETTEDEFDEDEVPGTFGLSDVEVKRKHRGILPNHVEPGHEYATLRRALDEGWDI